MTTDTTPLAGAADIDALAADLAAAGFDADGIPALLGAGAHNALARGHHLPARHVTARAAERGSALATLVRLFILGTTEAPDRVAAALPRLGLDAGTRAGVVDTVADGVRAALDIRPHADARRSFLVVSDPDTDTRPGPLRADHVLGIGAASITLAHAVIREPVDRVLDIGTGCGIQALHCWGHARSVTATDTNARALALARVTARLNGMDFDLREGSLFEPVAGERFDLIVANPPFVISPGWDRFAYRDSGLAGDQLCQELVAGVADHLTDGGTAQILANWIIPDGADWRLRVAAWVAATGCDGWVVQREVAHPAEYVALWLADAGEQDLPDADRTAAHWLDYFASEGIGSIGMGTITLRRRRTPATGGPDIVFDELTDPGDALTGAEVAAFLARRAWLTEHDDAALLTTRFALAENDLLHQRSVPGPSGWVPVLRMLRRAGGPGASVHLDEWGEALLGGCTGATSLGTQIELLATAHRVEPEALAATILPLVRTCITRGLLHPVDADRTRMDLPGADR